ncbi:MAG TPA: ABC transporter permease [Blastocatellia bacterium]|nr:ABC transporter permease [Blastocatellia bacterium]
MNTLFQDIRYSIRMLVKHRGFAGVALLALTLGIGINTAVFSVVNAVLVRPLPYPNPSQLAAIWGVSERDGKDRQSLSYQDFEDFRDQTQTLAQVAVYDQAGILLTEGDEPEAIDGLFVTSDLFPLLGVSPSMGRAFTSDEDKVGAPRVVVISHNLWERRFNSDPDIVGKEIQLSTRPYTIIGVMPAGFRFPADTSKTDFIMPFAPVNADALARRGVRSFRIAARLKPEVTIEQASAEINTISHSLAQQYPETNALNTAIAVSMRKEIVGDVEPSLILLLSAVGFVLLIACANVANLLLARATSRQKEIAIRTAVGASRSRIIRQLLTESFVLALAGGLLGLLAALWSIDLLTAANLANIPRINEVSLDGRVFGFTMAVSILTGLIFGLVPAIGASKPDLNETLKEGGRSSTEGRHRNRLRGLLVISEVALSLVLLVGAGLLIKSFVKLSEVKLGFDTDNVLAVQIAPPRAKYPNPQDGANFFQQVIERTNELPGVESAGVVNMLPLSGGNTIITFTIEGRPVPAGQEPGANFRKVSADYFRTMGIPVLQGRVFTEHDTKDAPHVIIVNETFARRYLPGEQPLGKRIIIGDDNPPPCEIVGVVGDIRHAGQDAEPAPEYYIPNLQDPARYMYLVARTSSPDSASMIAAVRSAIKEVNKTQYIPQVHTMDEMLAETVAGRRFSMMLVGAFASVALILAAVGIYGVISYSVTQRTHELGIRMALGAQTSDVLKLVIVQGLSLTIVGVAIGLVAAFALTRLMSGLLFGVSATDPLTFAVISLILTGVALVACFVPARRAAKVDPIVALRYE